jgi:hypothetical protein
MKIGRRRFSSKINVFKDKYLNPKNILNILIVFFLSAAVVSTSIYFVVYEGYKARLIRNVDLIPEELKTGVVIVDGNSENIEFFYEAVESLYISRKLNQFYLYIINPTNQQSENSISNNFEIPEDRIVVDTSKKDFTEICLNLKSERELDKFLIISFEDYAILSSFICNNKDLYSIAFTPELESQDLIIPETDFKARFESIIIHSLRL